MRTGGWTRSVGAGELVEKPMLWGGEALQMFLSKTTVSITESVYNIEIKLTVHEP
jgi:hypothetical protein